MLNRQDLLTLMKVTANAKPSAPTAYSFGEEKFSYTELNDALRNELNEYCGSWSLWRENKNMIFSLIEETIEEILPKRVLEQWGMFAEVKQFAQGDRPIFVQRYPSRQSKARAKQFVTKVGLAGVYEVFKLDGKREFEIATSAYGGAAQIAFEEFLDNRVQMSDVVDIILEGLDNAIYLEIERALKAATLELIPANSVVTTEFDQSAMDTLLMIADTYGQTTIYCTFEFAATMLPAESSMWSDSMKEQVWSTGRLGNYRGHNVVILPQSFEDETNTRKSIDPSYAWLIPAGMEKPVKIAIEGGTIVNEYDNRDLSKEVQIYKKLGVGALLQNNVCVYRNLSLTRTVWDDAHSGNKTTNIHD